MLFKLSLKNIKKSFKDYAIYFITLILGVAIFYVFNAIESQTVMMNVTASTREIIKLMTNMLSGVSVFVSLILGFLIIYASRFLIKRRNKEFGIYLTLGMGKRKISTILFLETLLIGILSLAVGLGIGVFLSQLMSLVVANMFEADFTKFTFVFSKSACIKTLGYFGIMYFIVMIFNTINISKCKLIDLLYANKKSEKIRLKNPVVCVIVFILSAILLGYAYYSVTSGIDSLQNANMIFIPIAIGIVTTFSIFWSISGLMLRIVMAMKKLYYKGLNSFILRQISSKINTAVCQMSVICLMLFVTICVLSASLSIKNSMTANLTSLAPTDIEIVKKMNLPNLASGYTPAQIEDSYISIVESLERLGFDTDTNLKDTVEVPIYATNEITIRTTLGKMYQKTKETYPYLEYENAETLISESDYNRLADLYHLEKIELDNSEYAVVADFDSWVSIRNLALQNNTPLEMLGRTLKPKYNHCINGFLYMSSNHINTGVFVVPDAILPEEWKEENILVANYQATTKDQREAIENQIIATENSSYASNTTLSATTKIAIYEASIGLGGLVTFIGLYLGIIFLISCAAILALRELSESSDNKNRYQMLRRLGADEKMIRGALFKTIAIFFLFPLILAIVHSIFGIVFCNIILSTFGSEQMLPSIIMTAVFLICIYGGYFFVTYLCSKNVIKE